MGDRKRTKHGKARLNGQTWGVQGRTQPKSRHSWALKVRLVPEVTAHMGRAGRETTVIHTPQQQTVLWYRDSHILRLTKRLQH
jgi:hypothetical protein